jgi:energy-coupling factor transporter ATP-binding protein EcfA2
MAPLRCHLLIGQPASGKTTLARALAPLLTSPGEPPAQVLSTDAIREGGFFGVGVAEGQVLVEVNPTDPSITVPIGQGEIFGEVGLISGRKRGATIRAGTDCILVEISRTAALKLMSAVPSAAREVTRVTTERSLLQIFKSGLSAADIRDVVAAAKVETVRAGQALMASFSR